LMQKQVFHFQKWNVITAAVLLVLLGWQWMVMMTDAISKIIYIIIALGLIVPMALFAVWVDDYEIGCVWEFRGKILRVIRSIPWDEVEKIEVAEKFFYKALKNIYVIPYMERKAAWRGYAAAVSFNSLTENCSEIIEKIMSRVPPEVDKSALEDFMKSLEPKPKSS
jgi:hypothetical protein